MKTISPEAACAFKVFVRAVTYVLNSVGVDETVSVLRRAAEDLEKNKWRLEQARARGQRVRGQA